MLSVMTEVQKFTTPVSTLVITDSSNKSLNSLTATSQVVLQSPPSSSFISMPNVVVTSPSFFNKPAQVVRVQPQTSNRTPPPVVRTTQLQDTNKNHFEVLYPVTSVTLTSRLPAVHVQPANYAYTNIIPSKQVKSETQFHQGMAAKHISNYFQVASGIQSILPASNYNYSTSNAAGAVQIAYPTGGNFAVINDGGEITGTAFITTARANPESVQWLLDNFEAMEGASLPRHLIYALYIRHCGQCGFEPMNQASFGKLVRSVFMGLKTRRLGTRGNSKYHYYGLRIKPLSPLFAQSEELLTPLERPDVKKPRYSITSRISSHRRSREQTDFSSSADEDSDLQKYLGDVPESLEPENADHHQISIKIPKELPSGIHISDLHRFEDQYREHCETIMDLVVNLHFSVVQSEWQSFWRTTGYNAVQEGDAQAALNEQNLPQEVLYRLCMLPCVREYVERVDIKFYQVLLEILMPDVLKTIPTPLTQMIRNFAKTLETWLKVAMTSAPDDKVVILTTKQKDERKVTTAAPEHVPQEMVDTKLRTVSAFAQTLRRYTSLNHLAQAARAVLQNNQQVQQMLLDLNRVDFAHVQEQARWVCNCNPDVVSQLEREFKRMLQQHSTLEQWAEWLESVVETILQHFQSSHAHCGADQLGRISRQFLLSWSFYSSMVIRDLTLRSAASFGSFHLMRLLYDEYMFYVVENKLASVQNLSPLDMANVEYKKPNRTSTETLSQNVFSSNFNNPSESSAKGTSTTPISSLSHSNINRQIGSDSSSQISPSQSLSMSADSNTILTSSTDGQPILSTKCSTWLSTSNGAKLLNDGVISDPGETGVILSELSGPLPTAKVWLESSGYSESEAPKTEKKFQSSKDDGHLKDAYIEQRPDGSTLIRTGSGEHIVVKPTKGTGPVPPGVAAKIAANALNQNTMKKNGELSAEISSSDNFSDLAASFGGKRSSTRIIKTKISTFPEKHVERECKASGGHDYGTRRKIITSPVTAPVSTQMDSITSTLSASESTSSGGQIHDSQPKEVENSTDDADICVGDVTDNVINRISSLNKNSSLSSLERDPPSIVNGGDSNTKIRMKNPVVLQKDADMVSI